MKGILSKVRGYAITLAFPLGIYAITALIALFKNNELFFISYTTNGIFTDSVLNCIVALAIAVPLSGGRWDFAPGAIAMLGGILGCNIGVGLKANVFVVLLLCVVSCLVLALLEGVVYLLLKVPNMIVSLGIVMIYEAISGLVYNGGGANLFANSTEYTDHLLIFSKAPYCYILLFVILLMVYFLLYKTKFGYDTKSLGANAKLAVNAGVREKKNILLTYACVGVLLGAAALLNASSGKIEPANNLSSTGLMFSSMAPVLVGLFLANYTNLPWGVLMGAIGMKVFSYAMNSFGIDGSMQTIVTGIVLTVIMTYINNKAGMERALRKLCKRKEAAA
jgi:ribose transport system permease protein